MAKKSKKISISVEKLVYACAAVLGLVALFLIFAPGAYVKTGILEGTFKASELVFGAEDYFAFSFLNLLSYLLLLGGIVLVVLKLANVKSKLVTFLGAALLIAAGVMLFLTISFAVPVEGYATVFKNSVVNLMAGPIVAGILSILSGASVLCYSILGKK